MRRVGTVFVSSVLLCGCALYADGGGDDAATITVTAYDGNGIPRAGHPVVFLDADDSVVDEATLDDAGVAHGSAPDGGSVVVLVEDSTTMPELAMWRNVHPGDTLVLGWPAVGEGERQSVAVTFPPLDGAATYVLQTSCDWVRSTTTSAAVAFCGDDHTLAILARDADDRALGTLHAADVDVSAPLDLSGPYTGNELVSIEFGSLPPGLLVEFTAMTFLEPFGMIDLYETELIVPTTDEGQATLVLEASVARTEGSTLQTKIMAVDGDHAPQVDLTHYTQSRLGGLYFGGYNAPELSNITYDPATATASWTAGPANRSASGTLASLYLRGGGRTAIWRISVASDATSVTLPTLPAAFDALAPAADEPWSLDLLEYVNDEPIMLPRAYASAFQIAALPSPLELMIDYTYDSASSP